ncbi:MAG: phosphate ABC transporter permease PstA [Acidimicrobiia bacterium]|nr:phosphate ABC transporter permease PstA [Acidimicrobiia bacterium]
MSLLEPDLDSVVRLPRQSARRRVSDRAFLIVLIISFGLALAGLVALLWYVFDTGLPAFGPRLWRRFPSLNPAISGARSAVFGTLWVLAVTAVLAVPIGIGAAVYLEEFAPADKWYTRWIALNIQNLAGVPSIVYGILGLAFIARGPIDLGPVVLTGGIILALLVLPIVIIASREAIRAVPESLRHGSFALGATRLQTARRQVLPAAVPGIATGVILALSRAIGEAAPLIMIGAFTYVPFNPTGLDSKFTVLPIQIFDWIGRPQEGFTQLAAAACILLLVILLVMNAIAIWLRNRYEQRW